jgi:hypothetical protein
MLGALQDHLAAINQADPGHNVLDFLITDPELAKILGRGSLVPETREAVLLSEDVSGLELSVFIDASVLKRLEGHDPIRELKPRQLDDLWKVLEGISHFNYLVWCASRDKAVTLFELEMQAEVDKFSGTWLLAIAQEDRELAHRIHGWLFENVSFNPQLSHDQVQRYRAANAIAARFCHGLRRRLRRDNRDGVRELRHFYRLSQAEKISHIHARSWRDK